MTEKAIAIPVASKERISSVDLLRGFALWGVIITNIYSFNSPPDGYIGNYIAGSGLDTFLSVFLKYFVQGKFYSIFSILFGVSFFIQIERLKTKYNGRVSVFARRLFILLVIGLAHSIFIWAGDVLKFYAIVGFLLLLFRNSSAKRKIRWAISLLVLYFVLLSAVIFAEASQRSQSNETSSMEIVNETEKVDLYSDGTYWEVCVKRIEFLTNNENLMYLVAAYLYVFPLFLLGAYLMHKGFFNAEEDKLRLLKNLFLYTIIPGLILSVISIVLYRRAGDQQYLKAIALVAEQVSNPLVALGYISGFILIIKKRVIQKILEPLKYVGRTALSTYLIQSIFFTFLLYGYGGQLLGDYSITQLFIVANIFFTIQIWASIVWLKYFRFGLFEYFWRCLTYKSFLKFKK